MGWENRKYSEERSKYLQTVLAVMPTFLTGLLQNIVHVVSVLLKYVMTRKRTATERGYLRGKLYLVFAINNSIRWNSCSAAISCSDG
jgi:hypothetical protein